MREHGIVYETINLNRMKSVLACASVSVWETFIRKRESREYL